MSADIISSLAGIADGSPLAELRAQRPESRDHAQGSYEALFAPVESTGLSGLERYAVALRVVSHHAVPEAIAHYRAGLVAAGADEALVKAVEDTSGAASSAISARLQALLNHADLLATHPVDASPDSHQALSDAGLSTGEIVTLSQIIAFLSFQVRVVTSLQLMGGGTGSAEPSTAPVPAAAVAGEPAKVFRPADDLKRPPVFTRDQLNWTPWLEPLDPKKATPRQAEGLASRPPSPYFRLLGWDGDILRERTATDLGIFYTHGGAPRADRELAAAAASRLNGCIFCASVHARAAATYSKRDADIDRMLDKGIGDIPALELGDRWTAVVDLAVDLARTPSSASTAQIEKLRSLGLSELEILDVAQAASFFSWANRLMLTLGEPYYE